MILAPIMPIEPIMYLFDGNCIDDASWLENNNKKKRAIFL